MVAPALPSRTAHLIRRMLGAGATRPIADRLDFVEMSVLVAMLAAGIGVCAVAFVAAFLAPLVPHPRAGLIPLIAPAIFTIPAAGFAAYHWG